MKVKRCRVVWETLQKDEKADGLMGQGLGRMETMIRVNRSIGSANDPLDIEEGGVGRGLSNITYLLYL